MARPPANLNAWQDCLRRLNADDTEHQGWLWHVFLRDLASDFPTRVERWLASRDFGHGPFNDLDRQLPAGWPKGLSRRYERVQAGRFQASALAVFSLDSPGSLQALLPELQRVDVCHPLTITAVNLWPNSVQADVVAQCGELELEFHDTSWMSYFHRYAAGQVFEFSLTGLALHARPAASDPITLVEPKWLDAVLENDPEPLPHTTNEDGQRVLTLQLKGMAALMPTPGRRCEYEFRGTVQELRPLPALFGEPAWLAIVTVAREFGYPRPGADALDLDIVLTRNIWGDAPLPAAGDDIEGDLWLQGCLTGM